MSWPNLCKKRLILLHLIAESRARHPSVTTSSCESHMNYRTASLTFAAQHSIYGRSRRRSEPIGLDRSGLRTGGWSTQGDRHEEVLSYAIPARPPRLLERVAG